MMLSWMVVMDCRCKAVGLLMSDVVEEGDAAGVCLDGLLTRIYSHHVFSRFCVAQL